MFWKKTEKKAEYPDSPREYPVGTCVRTESGTFYIGTQFKHPILTDRILSSWNFARVVETSDAAVSKYLKGKPLGFRSGTVIYDFSEGKTYAISGVEKRHIENPDRVSEYGLDYARDVYWVSKEEAELHKEGKPIN